MCVGFETCPAHGTLTVKTIIDLMSRSKNDWGIPGYEMPKNDYHNIHNHAVLISKIKKTSYLDDAIRERRFVPAPWQYNT